MKAQVTKELKPNSYIKVEVDNEIQDGKLPQNSGMNMMKEIAAKVNKKTIEMSASDYTG